MLYAAYGSNLNKEQMAERCPDAVYIGKAYLRDFKLNFRQSKTGYYLTIDKSEGGEVPVAVYWISEKDNEYLRIKEGFGLPECYEEIYVSLDIITKSGKTSREEKVLTYHLPNTKSEGSPKEEYYEKCRQGYRDHGFHLLPLEKAYKHVKRS